VPTKADQLESMKRELVAARDISARADAERRDYTATEAAKIEQHLKNAKSYKTAAEKADADDQLKAAIADFGSQIGLAGGDVKAQRPTWSRKRPGTSEWVKSVVDQVSKVSTIGGAKAVISGSYTVATPITTDVTRISEDPVRLIDLIINRTPLNQGNTFTWLKQTVRTNNAAVVADNALKPTSTFTYAEAEDRVRTIAHLSEATPERFLTDYTELPGFLEAEMEDGLYAAVETEILTGDGTGEHMTGLLNTSGILAQSFSSDLLTTTRKAATALEVTRTVPNAWAMHPADVETIDLLQDNEARFYYSGPQQQITSTNPLWTLPIAKSLAVPQGTAILGDWNFLRLVVREDARIDIDRSGDLFTHNQFKMRCELRAGVAAIKPAAFCQVDLSA